MLKTQNDNATHQTTRQNANHWEPTYIPRTDVVEQDQHYEIVVELPGVASDGIDLQVEKDELRLVATKRGTEAGSGNYLLRERRTGTYTRVFRLGEVVDRDRIDASIVDGVLRVRVPKAVHALPKKIAVS